MPGAHLVVDLPGGLRPVDGRVVLFELPGPGDALGRLRIARIAGREPLEDLRQELERALEQRRAHLLDRRPVILDRHGLLSEDRAGVELGVHAVPGHAERAVALAERPGKRNRPAVARQQRRVVVDRPEARHVERLLRQLPAEPPAEHEIGLEPAQQRRDRLLVAGEEQADPARAPSSR